MSVRKTGGDIEFLYDIAQRKNSIFGRRYLLTIWDEGHALRAEGTLNRAAMGTKELSAGLVIATATPLYNGERVSLLRPSFSERVLTRCRFPLSYRT